MPRFTGRVAVGILGALAMCAVWQPADAAPAPKVTGILEGHDGPGTRPVLLVLGKGLPQYRSFALKKPDTTSAGQVVVAARSANGIALRLPAALPAGTYTLELRFGAKGVQRYPVVVTRDTFLNSTGGTITGRLEVTSDDGVVFGGTQGGLGTIPATGAGTRFVWYPTKAALRAGHVDGTEWDDAEVGTYSVAMGLNAKASGERACAIGGASVASGFSAVAIGGSGCIASNDYAVAMGFSATASGNMSVALGGGTTATGVGATALGMSTTAQSFGSLAIGQFNEIAGTPTSDVATDPLFVAGNGASAGAPSNALTLLRNGDMTIAGSLTENSDERLKTAVVPLSGVLSKLAGVRAVAYRFADQAHGGAGPQVGVLAQELRSAFPELVHEGPGGTLSVAYGKLAAVLLGAVNEQQAEISAQRETLAAREREIAALRAELTRTQSDLAARLARLEAMAASAAK